jgi:hypothetical protein
MASPGLLEFMAAKVKDIFLIKKINPIFATPFA